MGSKNFFILLICFILSLFSCSNEAPKVIFVESQLYYDIETKTSGLSLFGSFPYDSTKITKIQLNHLESQVFWNIQNVENIRNKKNAEYFGYSAFIAPEKGFEPGEYEIQFFDEANRSSKISFQLKSFDLIEDIEKIKQLNNKEVHVGVFDENHKMIALEEENIEPSLILSKNKNAIYYRQIIKDLDNDIIYFLEKIFLKNTE